MRAVTEFEGYAGGQSPAPSNALEAVGPAVHQVATGCGSMLLNERQVAEAFGVSCRKVAELRSAGMLPAPIELGPRLLKWPRAEIEAAIANWPRREAAPEPRQLLRARIERTKKAGTLA